MVLRAVTNGAAVAKLNDQRIVRSQTWHRQTSAKMLDKVNVERQRDGARYAEVLRADAEEEVPARLWRIGYLRPLRRGNDPAHRYLQEWPDLYLRSGAQKGKTACPREFHS